MKSWQLSRRHMLRGLGATMSLPFLEAMVPVSKSFAAGAAGPDGQPVRFAAFFMPNGVNHAMFTPKGGGLGGSLPPILEPLADLKDHVTVITGMNNADSGHAAGTAAFLTARSPKKTGRASEVNVGNPSLDQIIAREFKGGTVLPALELGLHKPRSGVSMSGHSAIYTSFMTWKTATTPVPHEINPKRAFDRLFKGARVTSSGRASSGGAEPPRPDASVLDIVLEDARGLKKRLGYSDQQKLDEYLTAVREVEDRIVYQAKAAEGLAITPQVMDEIVKTRSRISKHGDSKGGSYRAVPNIPYQMHGQLMMDVMALAFWSNSTRVSTLMFGDGLHGRNMSFLEGVDGNHHSISHHGNKKENLIKFAKINTFFVGQYAYFLDRLRSMKEGSSNVLENSICLFGTNISSGQVHRGNNIPLILSGNAGGRLRGRRHIAAKGEPIGNLHRSILDLMDVDAKIGKGSGTLRGV